MARLNLKSCFVLMMMLCFVLIIFMIRFHPAAIKHFTHLNHEDPDLKLSEKPKHYEEIDCLINSQYRIPCRQETSDTFIPFSFVKKYFEVYGKLATVKGHKQLEWSHSYSKVYKPAGKYDSASVFMHFSNYNVETRDRVKCISAIEGIYMKT